MTEHDPSVSPVNWYVGSYVLRFIELEEPGNDDLEREFLVWENTVIVQAKGLEEAYDKVVGIAQGATKPYLGGEGEGVPVQWVFEGVTELVPIYEPLQDGAEILWAEHEAVKLSDLRKRAVTVSELRRHWLRSYLGKST